MALTKATLIDLNANELILDLDADTSITADSDDTIDFRIGGSDEIKMTSAAISPATADGNALGTAALEWSDLFLADGAVINFGAAQDITLTHNHNAGLTLNGVLVTTGLTIGSAAITEAELEILDGLAATTAELAIIDGDTSAGTTAVAGGDGIVTNDGGVMRQTTVDTFDTYLSATSKTLTNKTLTAPQINTNIDMLARAELRFQDASGGQYVAFEAPATVSSSQVWVLPSADGSDGHALKTDGSGTLTWGAVAANTPTSADGQALGSASLEWSDLFLADGSVINFGADQDINLTHVHNTGLTTNGTVQATVFRSTIPIWENAQTIAANYTITRSNNALSAGPITINSGISVTVPSGSSWAII